MVTNWRSRPFRVMLWYLRTRIGTHLICSHRVRYQADCLLERFADSTIHNSFPELITLKSCVKCSLKLLYHWSTWNLLFKPDGPWIYNCNTEEARTFYNNILDIFLHISSNWIAGPSWTACCCQTCNFISRFLKKRRVVMWIATIYAKLNSVKKQKASTSYVVSVF